MLFVCGRMKGKWAQSTEYNRLVVIAATLQSQRYVCNLQDASFGSTFPVMFQILLSIMETTDLEVHSEDVKLCGQHTPPGRNHVQICQRKQVWQTNRKRVQRLEKVVGRAEIELSNIHKTVQVLLSKVELLHLETGRDGKILNGVLRKSSFSVTSPVNILGPLIDLRDKGFELPLTPAMFIGQMSSNTFSCHADMFCCFLSVLSFQPKEL